MSNFIKEFKEFIMRGNVMDMAVGVIIGGAFTAIVNSLMDDILNPLIGLFSVDGFEGLAVQVGGTSLTYGNFISAILNFLIVAFVVFLMVKGLNKLQNVVAKPEEPAEEEAAPAPTEAELLAEIRDLLKETKTTEAE